MVISAGTVEYSTTLRYLFYSYAASSTMYAVADSEAEKDLRRVEAMRLDRSSREQYW
jgi:hypothetical protein